MRLGLLILVASLAGFFVSQLYIAWSLAVYTLQIPEYIRQKLDGSRVVLEVKYEKPLPIVTVFFRDTTMVSDLVFMYNDVDGFADAVLRLYNEDSLCENGVCRVVLYLSDGYYYVESRAAGSEWGHLLGLNIKQSAVFWVPGQFLSFLGLVFGAVLGLCLVWKAKNLDEGGCG